MAWADHVHFPIGFQPAGSRVRALCHCGEMTTPRVDRTHALLGLAEDHGWTRPTCARCGRDRTPPDASFDQFHRDLTVAADLPGHPGEVLICRDEVACAAARRPAGRNRMRLV